MPIRRTLFTFLLVGLVVALGACSTDQGGADQGTNSITEVPTSEHPDTDGWERLFQPDLSNAVLDTSTSWSMGPATRRATLELSEVDPVLALAGWWHRCRIADGATVPVHRMEPFMLFPEGRADELLPDPAEPLVWCRDDAAGRRVHFALDIGRVALRSAHPDPERLLLNALRWAGRERAVPLVDGRPDLRVSLRGLPGKRLVHLINTGGRHRFRTGIEPLRDLEIHLPGTASRAWLADGGDVDVSPSADGVAIRVPELAINDILVVED